MNNNKSTVPISITDNITQHNYRKDNFSSEEIEAANFLGSRKMEILKIDHDQQRYPYCIGYISSLKMIFVLFFK